MNRPPGGSRLRRQYRGRWGAKVFPPANAPKQFKIVRIRSCDCSELCTMTLLLGEPLLQRLEKRPILPRLASILNHALANAAPFFAAAHSVQFEISRV